MIDHVRMAWRQCFAVAVASIWATGAMAGITMCNDSSFDVAYVFLYDQTEDLPQFRRGDDQYRAGGWLYIDSGKCDRPIPLANGQYIYLGFSRRSYDAGGAVEMSASGLPRGGRLAVRHICADTKKAFDVSSNDISRISTICPLGFQQVPVSFGLRGGTGNFTIRLNYVPGRFAPLIAPDSSKTHNDWVEFMKPCAEELPVPPRINKPAACACISLELEKNFSPPELTYAFPSYFATDVSSSRRSVFHKCGHDTGIRELLPEINARLTALGYERWVEPDQAPPEIGLPEIALEDGYYYCREAGYGIHVEGNEGYAITEVAKWGKKYLVQRGERVFHYAPDDSNNQYSLNIRSPEDGRWAKLVDTLEGKTEFEAVGCSFKRTTCDEVLSGPNNARQYISVIGCDFAPK